VGVPIVEHVVSTVTQVSPTILELAQTGQLGPHVEFIHCTGLTEEAWRALADHGVTRIVDLRWPEELAEDQPRDVDIDVVHVSVLGPNLDDTEYIAYLDAHLDSVDDAAEHHAWSYLDFLERYRDRFGQALAAVADADDGAVVVHCMGGKDRTGLVAALLLRNAGVSREEIGRRYAADVPLGRIGRPEDIAAACAFLISEEAGYITGQILGVNGGRNT
jgi:hypothetical protein